MVPLLLLLCASVHGRNFTVSNDVFMKDGEEFKVLAGCIHYARVPPQYWEDRLLRMKAMGMNSIQTYVPWNVHETVQGEFDFTGPRDLTQFLAIAKKVGLVVLLRAGPYMCGEWEFGGFPAWLLNLSPPVTLRTYQETYIKAVDAYWAKLFSVVKPSLYEHGGPVVMVQVENEYGSYGDVSKNPADKQYMEHLVAQARLGLGSTVLLYTTDGGNTGYMERGSLKGGDVITCGDGCGNPEATFAAARAFNAKGQSPPLCSEYYSGWLTHWGESMANTSSSSFAASLDKLLGVGSVAIYMGEGGSNFGFMSGANGGGSTYQPHITSYDYDSPISEAGDHGYGSDGIDKYSTVQEVLRKHNPDPVTPEPSGVPKVAYPVATLAEAAPLFKNLGVLCDKAIPASYPSSMESYGQNYGFILYRVTVPQALVHSSNILKIVNFARDRVQVFANGVFMGVDYRPSPSAVNVTATEGLPVVLDLLVENMGRLNYGRGMTDPKGITDGVLWNAQALNGTGITYAVYTLPLEPEQIAKLAFSPVSDEVTMPAFYSGTLTISGTPQDTYVHTAGWSKGIIWVNGVNLGRYWEAMGPQHTLYLPAPFLKSGDNDIIVLELDKKPTNPTFVTQSTPDFHTGHTCDLSGTPAAGDTVVMWASSSVGTQKWTYQNKQLRTTNGLCLQAASPSVEIQKCDASNPKQKFEYSSNGELKVELSCLDIFSHDTKNGARVETYACNNGPNQQWVLPTGEGPVSSKQDGHVLTVCA